MKKLYAIQTTMRNLKNSRFSFVKVMLLLAIMIAFLSNVFSVNAGDVQPKNVNANEKAKSSRISSSVPVNEQVTASDPMNAGVMNVDVTASAEGLQANDVGAEVSFMEGQGAPVTERAFVSYNDPTSLRARLAANTGGQQFVQSDEKPSIINVSDLLQSTLNNGMQRAVSNGVVGTNVVFGNDLKFASEAHNENDNVVIGTKISMLGVDSVAVGYGVQVDQSQAVAVGHLAHAVGKKSIAIGGEGRMDDNPIPPEGRTVSGGDYSIAVGHRAKTSKADGIAIGHMAHTTGISSIAIGGDYNKKSEHGDDDYTTAGADYTTAVGAVSKALGYGSTVLGHRAYASAEKAISIGLYSKASEVGSIALGTDSNVTVKDGIALGRDSVASRDAGILGYAPSLKGTTTNTKAQWKSTHGVVSVGDYDKNITRQITGVAAGSELSDAVNVGQLKDLEDVVRKNGWKLSVDNANGTTVPMNSGVDFSAESKNLKITKGDKDNKVKFDLAKDVTLSSAKMGGGTTLDATGLVIVNGPKITTTGISAGNKEIKDIKNGDLSATSNQAVNGSQLFETNKNVTTVSNDLKTVAQHAAQYFGGGAGYTNGKWSDPNFKVNTFKSDGSTVESTYHTVAEALADVGSSFTNIKNKINAERSNELVKWDEDTKSINIGKEKGDAKISIADKGSQSRILSGLKAAEKGDEAVNKAQLDQNVHKLSNDINNVRSVAVFYDTEEDTEKVSAFTRSVRKEVKKNSVTFGNPKEGTVGLHNVGNGNIAKDSHDAVNGSQLYSMGDTVATYFGGSASFKDGSLIAPTYKISNVTEDGKATEKSYNDVGSAFAGLDTSVKNVNTHLTNEVKKFEEKITNITQEVQGDALLWSKDAHAFVATHGEKDSKTNSKITSLLDGAINDSSTDAVTGKQLHTLGTGVAKSLGGNAKYENGTWSDPTFKVKSFAFDGSFSDSTYNDVASAFEGVGTSFEKVKDSIMNVKNEITQEIKNEITTVQGDALLWDNAKSAFVATHGKEGSKTNSKLTSLLDGTINDSSTDAVTGKQLHSLGDKVAKSLGGGANYENGTWISPKFTVKTVKDDGETIEERKYDTVAEALAGVGTSFTNIKNDITNVVSDSLVKWDEDTKSINIGKEKDDAKISIADKNSKSRTLSGLKAAEKGDEAVNKAQLDENVNTLTNEIKDVRSVAVFYDTEENSEDSDVSTFMRSARKAKRNSVTFGNPKEGTVGLHNVGDGNIAKDSHDAVNGSQLYSMGDTVATYFGGSASFKDGSLTAPTYKISNVTDDGKATEKSYNDVGSAFAGLDTSVKNVNTHLTQEVKKFEEKITNITQAIQGDALLWSKSDNAFVATHGENKGNSKITSLQAGQIAEASSDAINGSQLYSVGDTVAKYFGGGAGYKNGEWTAPQFTVKKFSAEGEATEENYNNVADAFAEISSSVTKIHNEFKDEINTVVSDNLVKQDKDRAPITIGKETDGVEINIQNKNKENRVLSGVKEATKDNEAVNKAQLEKSLKELSKNIQSEDSAVILYDKGTDGKTDYSNVTFGGKDKSPVGLHNVADGKIAKDSRDAITGGQVNKIGEDVAKFLGGNAKFSDGAFTEPTYKLSKLSEDGAVEETSYNNVGSAFAGLDENIKNVNERIKDVSESVAQDSLNWNEGKKAFVATHGEDKANSKITSLLDGAIDDSSTDAVTGKQLHALGDKVAKSLGGDAGYAEGKWTAPKFTVKTVNENGSAVEEHEYDTVVAAFADVGASFENLQKEITQSNTEVAENIKQNALLWSEKDHAFVATHGKDGEKVNSKITSLQAGDISESSTDAVNGSQLYSMGSDVAKYLGGGSGYAEGKWTAPSFKVKSVNEDGKTEDKEYSDVASAFAGVGTSFTNIKNEINKEITNVVSDSLVKFDEKTNLIKIGGEKESASINIADKDSKDRILSGVKKAENDNEAVNKGQLDESLKDLSNSLQSDDSAVVHYDKKDDDTSSINYTSVTFGKGKDSAPVSLHNVADGTLSEGSHDVVNGGQVSKIGKDLAKFLGGEASFKDGAFTGPTYKLSKVSEDGQLEDKSFENVGAAFTGLDENIKNVNQRIKDVSESVAQDSLNWNEKEGAFVAQHGEEGNKTNSKITSLQAGDISDSSTDAVNGSQLYSLNTTLAQYLGGGSGYAEGKWTAPSFKVKTINEDGSAVEEQSYESVAEAFAGVGTSFTNIHNEVKNEINKVVGDSLVKQDEETKVIKIGGEKTGNEITIANSDGAARSLSGVKAASLSETSTEAVNGSQLYSLNTTLAKYFGGGAEYKDGEWKAPEFKVTTYDDDGVSHEESYESVAAAFAGVSSSFTKLHNEVSNNLEQNALLWSDEDQAFVALHGKGGDRSKSKLKSLLDGDISEGSTEAITGNQLYSMSNALASYLGGGAEYKDGAWTAPSFKVLQFNADGSSSSKQSYPDVASAFDGVSESMTSINDRVQEVEKNVASNSLNWNEETGSYDARHKGEASKITNVAAGKIEKGSQEVVNGGQLWITNEKIKDVENRVDTIDQQVQDITIAVTDGAVNYDKDADGKKTNSITLKGGNESEPVLIDNLADGRIEKGSKEAINGGQLHDYTDQQMKIVLDDAKKYTDDQVNSLVNNGVNEAKSYTDIKFETLSYVVEDVRKEARQAAAIGLAVSNLSYDDIPGKFSVSFGTGTWRSQSAIAFGAGYMSEDGKIRTNVSATSAGGHWGVGAGLRITLN